MADVKNLAKSRDNVGTYVKENVMLMIQITKAFVQTNVTDKYAKWDIGA